jgi:hypothetical protein
MAFASFLDHGTRHVLGHVAGSAKGMWAWSDAKHALEWLFWAALGSASAAMPTSSAASG